LDERRVEVVLMVLEDMRSSSCLQQGQHTRRHTRTSHQLLNRHIRDARDVFTTREVHDRGNFLRDSYV
jgi:hypothetical protein